MGESAIEFLNGEQQHWKHFKELQRLNYSLDSSSGKLFGHQIVFEFSQSFVEFNICILPDKNRS